ncbi:MAG TPA: glycosyltransferase family 9 protein, partial [bacterium]|nr:glycosyltransferase family 9 protein [bacterium]
MLLIRDDCKHYKGSGPCRAGRLCEGCGEYSPWKESALIIKTGAMGDVLRTTSILPALKEKHRDAKVSWLTSLKAEPLLRGNPFIDEIVVTDAPGTPSSPSILARKFDVLFSLDKTAAECGIAEKASAGKKFGVGLSRWGAPVPFGPECDYYFSLGLSDDLKFKQNKRTYGDMILEVCGLDGKPAAPILSLDGEDNLK